MTEPTTALAPVEGPSELELAEQARRERKPIPTGNGLLAPARWEMFGRIANTVGDTEFVPKGLRGNKPAVMACLLYGDALGLHPNVALTEVHIVDGRPTMSATLMVGMIRAAGHKIHREEIRQEVDGVDTFVGTIAHGVRGDDGETDSFRYDLTMAARAGLMSKDNWRKYPEAMCWARAVSQLARMLFPDVFLGQSTYTAEEIGLAETDEYGAPLPEGAEPAQIEEAPTLAAAPAAAEAPSPEPPERFEVRLEDGTLVGSVERGTNPLEALGLHDTHEIARVDDDGTMVVREITAEDGGEPELVDESESAEDVPLPAASPGEQMAFASIAAQTIPKILEIVASAHERGDDAFIRGVLAHETSEAGKKRKNLIAHLEDAIAEIEEATRRYQEENDAAAQLEHEAKLAEESAAENAGDVVLAADAPANPFAAAIAGAPAAPAIAVRWKVVEITAASAWMREHHPDDRNFWYESLVVTAQHIYGSTHAEPIHSLADLTDEEADQVWSAIPEPARAAVGELDPDGVQALAAKALAK